jgi:hypothetical protein
MNKEQKVKEHLQAFVNELISTNKIYDIHGFDIHTKYDGKYREDKDDSQVYQKSYDEITYKISLSVKFTAGWECAYLNTEYYDDPYKCLMDIKFRIDNEIKLKDSIKNLNKKIEEIDKIEVDELAFLKIEMQEALDEENYEKADDLKKKIDALTKNKKTKKND